MTYYDILFSFFIYGFLGWCTEVAYAAFKQHSFVNRGFLNGPICPIYGIGVTVVVALLQPYVGNLILLYITSTILVTFLEWLNAIEYRRLCMSFIFCDLGCRLCVDREAYLSFYG